MERCLCIAACCLSAMTADAGPDIHALHAAASGNASYQLSPSLTLQFTRSEFRASGWSAFGTVEGDQWSSFAITLVDDQLSGGIWTSRGAYSLTNDGLSAIPPSHGPNCLSPDQPGLPPPRPIPIRAPTRESQSAPASPPPFDARCACDCSDDPGTVDVLFVYTTLAKSAAGGLAPLTARLQNVIDTTNLVFANSDIADLTLAVADMREIDYDEASPQWLDHLVRLTEPSDGIIDQIHAWRDDAQADCVMLIVDDTRFTGGAAWWALWSDTQAFSVLNWRSAGNGILTGPHEFGHNFGCAHDRANDASAPYSYTWGYDYTDGPDTWGTVMSYVGTTLPYFSSPYLTGPGGHALGVPPDQPDAAFNALIVSQSRTTLANYRKSTRLLDCNNNGIDDAIDIGTGASADLNEDDIPDECQTRVYVDADVQTAGDGSTWERARRNLSEVMQTSNLNCSSVSEVWVADGTYLPDPETADPWARFSLRSSLALVGGFQGESHPSGGETAPAQRTIGAYSSILSGDIGIPSDPSDNTYSILDAFDTDHTALLDGFTVRDGNSFADAAGMYGERAGPTIRNTVFTLNRAPGAGAAAAFYDNASPTFANCTFENNTTNWIAGALAINTGSLRLDNCVFLDNHTTSYGGAIDAWNSTVTVSNSLFARNASDLDGGAISMGGGTTMTIAGSTIADNTAIGLGGGVTLSTSNVDIANSIIWNNTSAAPTTQQDQIYRYTGTITPNYTCIEGLDGSLGGVGNIGLNPRFVSANDFHLSPDSPCLDAASNALVPADALDLDNDANTLEPVPLDLDADPRFTDDPAPDTGDGTAPITDMGAYERTAPCTADWNADTITNTADFIAYLNDYNLVQAGQSPTYADPDIAPPIGVLNTADFIAYLNAFTTGCP